MSCNDFIVTKSSTRDRQDHYRKGSIPINNKSSMDDSSSGLDNFQCNTIRHGPNSKCLRSRDIPQSISELPILYPLNVTSPLHYV